MSAHAFEWTLRVMAAAVIVIGAAQLVCLAWLAVRRERSDRRAHEFSTTLLPWLPACMSDPDLRRTWVERARCFPSEVVRGGFTPFLLSTSAGYRQELRGLYAELGLLAEDRRALRSRFWTRRTRAVRRLMLVATHEERALALPLCADRDPVRRAVAHLMGRIGSRHDLWLILQCWRPSGRWSVHELCAILDEVALDDLRGLAGGWARFASTSVRCALLSVSARRLPAETPRLFRAALFDPSLDVRIEACRAAARLPGEAVQRQLTVLLNRAPEWEVRAAAARALRARADRSVEDALAAALGDRAFWVRQNAGASLSHQGQKTAPLLARIANDAEDRFARDTALQALAEGQR